MQDKTSANRRGGTGVEREVPARGTDGAYVYVGNDPINNVDPMGTSYYTGNGCGEGWWNRLVPDWIFRSACNYHDRCFAYHWKSFMGCNNTFWRKMAYSCWRWKVNRWYVPMRLYTSCIGTANAYWGAVSSPAAWCAGYWYRGYNYDYRRQRSRGRYRACRWQDWYRRW